MIIKILDTENAVICFDEGENLRANDIVGDRCYRNSARERTEMEAECPAELVADVMTVWGEAPTVFDEAEL